MNKFVRTERSAAQVTVGVDYVEEMTATAEQTARLQQENNLSTMHPSTENLDRKRDQD